jgi:antitoxin component YwqK of YwqJK toxin-antitoxin module
MIGLWRPAVVCRFPSKPKMRSSVFHARYFRSSLQLIPLLGLLAIAACGPTRVPLARTEERADGLRYQLGKKAPLTGILLVPRDSATGVSVTMPFAAGLREGNAEGWHANGKRAFAETWKAGKREGLREEWDSAGHLARTETFVDGQLEGLMKDFSPTGTVILERPMHAGQQAGLVKHWYPDGSRKSEAQYQGDRLQGTMTFWYPNGKKKYEGTFVAGKPDGVVREWWEDGTPKALTTWKVGIAEGPFTRWWANGQKKTEGIYRQSKAASSRSWSLEGKLIPRPPAEEGPASPHAPG